MPFGPNTGHRHHLQHLLVATSVLLLSLGVATRRPQLATVLPLSSALVAVCALVLLVIPHDP
jgi:hypothetical protein